MPRPFSKHAVPRGCIAESKATAVTLAMGNGAAVASGTPLQASLSVPVSSPQPHYKLQHRAAGPPSSVSVSARTRSNSYVRAARPAALSTGHTRRRSAFRDGTARAAATLVRPHARGEKLAGPFSTHPSALHCFGFAAWCQRVTRWWACAVRCVCADLYDLGTEIGRGECWRFFCGALWSVSVHC